MTEIFVLLILLQIKHYIADFLLQNDYILQNRRHYGHPGGLLHVGIHTALSLLVFILIGAPFSALLLGVLVFEIVVHYHVDWAKDNFNDKIGLGYADRQFWWLMGLDQVLHQLTNVAMVYMWFAWQ